METLSRLPPPLPLICRLCPLINGLKRRLPVKENLRWKGSNSNSNFHHRNINEGANNLHYVTGRSIGISGLLSVSMSMGTAVSIPSAAPKSAALHAYHTALDRCSISFYLAWCKCPMRYTIETACRLCSCSSMGIIYCCPI
jgi:hypothetical protein